MSANPPVHERGLKDVLPPHLTMEECVGVCMAVLGTTRAESVAALHLVLEQTPKKAACRIGCAYGTFRSHTRAILLKINATSSIGIATKVVAVLWSAETSVVAEEAEGRQRSALVTPVSSLFPDPPPAHFELPGASHPVAPGAVLPRGRACLSPAPA